MIVKTKTEDPERTPMFGRRDEMEWLRDRISLAAAGRGSVTLVEGVAGSGKTRLLNELARVCHHGHITTLRSERQNPTDQHGAVLFDGVADDLHHLGNGQDGTRIDLWSQLLAQAQRQPTVLLLDDIHLADDTSQQLLLDLARASTHLPLLIIATLDPSLATALHEVKWALQQHEHSATLRLDSLSEGETRLLVSSYLAPSEVGEDLLQSIHELSGGRPDLIQACLERWKDQGILYQVNGVWLNHPVDEPEIPPISRASLSMQLKQLNDQERTCLAHAALQGRCFSGALVATTLGAEALPTLRMLSRLQRTTDLIEAREEGFRFVHPATATLCQWQLSSTEREAALQKLVAPVAVARRTETDPLTTARHLHETMKTREAITCLLDASRSAVTVGDHRLARRCQREALSIDDESGALSQKQRHQLLLEMAESEMRLGETVAAISCCRAALDICHDASTAAHTDLLMAEIWLHRSRWADATHAIDSALQTFEVEPDPPAQARACMQLALMACRRSRLADAGNHLAQAQQSAPAEIDATVACRLQRLQALLAAARGSYVEAIVRLSKLLRDERRRGSDQEIALTYGELGQVHLAQGQCGPALACFQSSMDLARSTSDNCTRGRSMLGMAKALAAAGRVEEARESVARARALMTASDDGAGLALSGLVEAQIFMRDECLDDAERALQGCRPRLLEMDHRLAVAECDRELGLLKRQCGDDNSARHHLSESLRGYQETGAIAEALKTHRLLSLTTE